MLGARPALRGGGPRSRLDQAHGAGAHRGKRSAAGGGTPVIGGSPEKLAEDVAAYAEIGLDELIIPDSLLGAGAERLKAMDVIRGIV